MNKRYALWGGLLATMALIIIVMVRVADDDTNQAPASAAIQNSGTAESEILAPRDNDWIKGNPDADVVVVKYSDFQCPACRFYASMDDQLSQEMGDDVLFIFRHFPLSSFEHSNLASRYTEAAGRQDKFWRMHDLIYINQQRWSRSNDAESIFRQFADSIDLDMAQLDEDLEDPDLMARIRSDYEDGQRLGVRAVPSLFINGEMIQNPNSMDEYREMIESRL